MPEAHTRWLSLDGGAPVQVATPAAIVEALGLLCTPGRWLAVGRDDGSLLVSTAGAEGRLALEHYDGRRRRWHRSLEGELPGPPAFERLAAFADGDPGWGYGLRWERLQSAPRAVLCRDGQFHRAGEKGGFVAVSPAQHRRQLRRVFRNEVILLVLLAAVIALGVQLWREGAFVQEWRLGLLGGGAILAALAGLHWLNWHCPLCQTPLGLRPARRCACSRLPGR